MLLPIHLVGHDPNVLPEFRDSIALSSAALMSPPMQVEWSAAEVVVGGEGLNVDQRCCVENAKVLVVLASQTASHEMSTEERKDFEAAMRERSMKRAEVHLQKVAEAVEKGRLKKPDSFRCIRFLLNLAGR